MRRTKESPSCALKGLGGRGVHLDDLAPRRPSGRGNALRRLCRLPRAINSVAITSPVGCAGEMGYPDLKGGRAPDQSRTGWEHCQRANPGGAPSTHTSISWSISSSPTLPGRCNSRPGPRLSREYHHTYKYQRDESKAPSCIDRIPTQINVSTA